jgi:hypothetical protein
VTMPAMAENTTSSGSGGAQHAAHRESFGHDADPRPLQSELSQRVARLIFGSGCIFEGGETQPERPQQQECACNCQPPPHEPASDGESGEDDVSVLVMRDEGGWEVRWEGHPALDPAALLGIATSFVDQPVAYVNDAVEACGRHGEAWEALETDEPAQLAHACDVLRGVARCVANELAAVPTSVVDALPPRTSLALRLLFPRNRNGGGAGTVDDSGGDHGDEEMLNGNSNCEANVDDVGLEAPEFLATLLLLAELEARLNALDVAVGGEGSGQESDWPTSTPGSAPCVQPTQHHPLTVRSLCNPTASTHRAIAL